MLGLPLSGSLAESWATASRSPEIEREIWRDRRRTRHHTAAEDAPVAVAVESGSRPAVKDVVVVGGFEVMLLLPMRLPARNNYLAAPAVWESYMA